MTLRARRARIGVVVSVSAVLLAGCSSEGTSSEAPPPPGPPPTSTPAGAVPVPLDQRVVQGDLAGMQSPAGVKAATTKETYVENQTDRAEPDYAQERAGDIAKLADKGFVAGASKVYVDKANGAKGLSTVVQLGGPDQAKAYEQALYTEEFRGVLTPTAQQGTVAGAATSHTVMAKVSEDGETVSHAWASFVDGPFVYLEEAESEGSALNSQAVIDAANALYPKVKGAPAS